MRRFLPLAKVLLVAAVAAGSPLATVSTTHQVAVPSIVSTPSLLCILPQCDGPYCRASNGCLVCCTH
ncbi:MAG TPA: hypothetical protein VH988_05720 [Thermoanaerobaculia bacterium]|nr:hypothetical protein [Thermoanaerobaculia bacterium]